MGMLKSPLDSLQIKGEKMIGVAEVRPGGCIYEPCLDIMPGWGGVRSMFGSTALYGIMPCHILIL